MNGVRWKGILLNERIGTDVDDCDVNDCDADGCDVDDCEADDL